MEENSKHNIDDFFNKAFNQSPSEETWNVPSEEVWENLLEATREEKKRRPILYWRWMGAAAAIALLIFGGIQFNSHQKQLKHQANQIDSLEKQIENLSNKNLQDKKQIIDNPIIKDKEASFVEEEKAVSKNNTQSRRIEVKSSDANSDIATDPFLENQSSELVNSEVDNKDLKNEKIKTIAVLKTAISPLESPFPTIKLPLTKSILEEKAKPYLTANYSILESAQKYDRHSRVQRVFRSEVTSEKAINVGLRTGLPLSKNWFFETGLHYFESTAERTHRPKPKFKRNNERLNNRGQFESEYPLQFVSSEYVLETDLVLSRSTNSSIEEGKEIDLQVVMKNEIADLQLPLLLAYRKKYNRFQLNFKGGLLAKLHLKNEAMIEKIILENSIFEIDDTKRVSTRPLKENSKVDLNYYLGAALAYQLSDDFTMQIEPYFTQNIAAKKSPFPNLSNASIRSKATGVNVGLSYNF